MLINQVKAAKSELKHYADSLEKTIETRTKELEELSLRDMLTGLYNQRAFFDFLRREMSNAERYKESLVLCYFDLNDFKVVNDKQGHQAGDDVLISVGKIIKECVRESDIACRYGGDEFAIILPRSSLDEANIFSKRLTKEFKQASVKKVSFSMGIACVGPNHFVGYEELLSAADKEMYSAKSRTKKRKGFYTSSIFLKGD
ncbi:MAG: GGDEF domain-containing protein [Woeseiaceae bacterium]